MASCRRWAFALAVLAFSLVPQVAPAARASCIAPSANAQCTRDDQCCGGSVCAAVCKRGCKIDKVFYANGTINRANDCQWCQAAVNRVGWTNRAADTACGSASQTACDNPNTCNGSGICLDNHVADATNCGTPGQCEVQDTCSGGACTDNGFKQGTVCRAKAGNCDVEETCPGNGPDCPADTLAAARVRRATS